MIQQHTSCRPSLIVHFLFQNKLSMHGHIISHLFTTHTHTHVVQYICTQQLYMWQTINFLSVNDATHTHIVIST